MFSEGASVSNLINRVSRTVNSPTCLPFGKLIISYAGSNTAVRLGPFSLSQGSQGPPGLCSLLMPKDRTPLPPATSAIQQAAASLVQCPALLSFSLPTSTRVFLLPETSYVSPILETFLHLFFTRLPSIAVLILLYFPFW